MLKAAENIHPPIVADISLVHVIQHSECAACLDVLVAKKKLDGNKVKKEKDQLNPIVSMLIGLIRDNSERNV